MTFAEGTAALAPSSEGAVPSRVGAAGRLSSSAHGPIQREAATDPDVEPAGLSEQFSVLRPPPAYEPTNLTREELASANRKNRARGPYDPLWVGHLQRWLHVSVTGHLGEETMDALASRFPTSKGVLERGVVASLHKEAQAELANPTDALREATARQLLADSKFKLPEAALRPPEVRAKATTGKEVVAVEKATGVSWSTWTAQFQTSDFLGFPVTGHPWLLQRLGAAEQYLLARLRTSNAAEARERLHVKDPRTDPTMSTPTGNYNLRPMGGSFHTLGLAIDINKPENPWVATEAGGARAAAGNRTFTQVSSRATELMGFGEPVTGASLSRAGKETTEEAWRRLQDSNVALRLYRSYAGDQPALEAHFNSLPRDSPARRRGLDYWKKQVAADHAELLVPSRSNYNNETDNTGFMDHQRELVIALRDVGGLAWGAVDLGAESGDVMHFDTRSVEKGMAITSQMTKLNRDGSPKQPEPARATDESK